MRVLFSWVGQRDPWWGDDLYHDGPVLTFVDEYVKAKHPPFDRIVLFFTPGEAAVPGAGRSWTFAERADHLRATIARRLTSASASDGQARRIDLCLVELDEPHLFAAVQAALPPKVRLVLQQLRRERDIRSQIDEARLELAKTDRHDKTVARLADALADAMRRLEEAPDDERAERLLRRRLVRWYRHAEGVSAAEALRLRRSAREPIEVHVLISPGTPAQAWGWLHLFFAGMLGNNHADGDAETEDGPVLWQVRDPTRSLADPVIRTLALEDIVRPVTERWLDQRITALRERLNRARAALAELGVEAEPLPAALPSDIAEDEVVARVGWAVFEEAAAQFPTNVAVGRALGLPESVVRDRYRKGRARPRHRAQPPLGAVAQLVDWATAAPRAPEEWV
jgi:hypothetical protein